MKRLLAAALALLTVLSLCACGAPGTAQSPDAAAGEQSWSELTFDRTMPLRYATHFAVEYAGERYTRITIDNDRVYLVVADGAAVPDGVPEEVTVLQQPLDQIYLVASAAMDNFEKLDAVSAITLSGRKESDWYIQGAQEAMRSGAMVYAGKYSEPDYELILSQGCDLAVENTMIYHSPEVLEQLERLGIPVLVETSSYEDEPFGRMEWIKLYAALLNKEDEAESLFDAKMNSVAGILDQEPTGKSVSFFYITSTGAVNVRKSTDYVAKSITMAGGDYVSFDASEEDNAQSTVNIQMEAFYNGAVDADVLIYNSIIDGELSSIDELVALNPLLADFKAVKDGNVWCLTKDFYQESLELSDLILDINHALTESQDASFRFLTRLH